MPLENKNAKAVPTSSLAIAYNLGSSGKSAPAVQLLPSLQHDRRKDENAVTQTAERSIKSNSIATTIERPSLGTNRSQGEAPVQRAIGFEFETNAELSNKRLPYKHELHAHNWDGKKVVEYGPGWHAHVDGGKVEFATQPVERVEHLAEQISSIQGAAENMDTLLKVKNRKTVPVKDAMGLGSCEEQLNTQGKNRDLYTNGIYADIQNTVSMELSMVPQFYSRMGESGRVKSDDHGMSHSMYQPSYLGNSVKLNLPAPREIVEVYLVRYIMNAPELWREFGDDEFRDSDGNPISSSVGRTTSFDVLSYEGVITTIVDYLNDFVVSNSLNTTSDYVKSDFPILQRVNFVKMLGSFRIEPEWQDLIFRTLPQLVIIWADSVLSLNPESKYLVALKKSFRAFKTDGDIPKFLESIPTMKASKTMAQEHLPSVGQWLNGIMYDKKDMLSSVDNRKHDSESMGDLEMDNVGDIPKVIFENRSLQTRNTYDQWGEVALNVFNDYKKKMM